MGCWPNTDGALGFAPKVGAGDGLAVKEDAADPNAGRVDCEVPNAGVCPEPKLEADVVEVNANGAGAAEGAGAEKEGDNVLSHMEEQQMESCSFKQETTLVGQNEDAIKVPKNTKLTC